MSIASEYAARQAVAAADLVTANQSEPPKLEGPNAIISVDADGNCRITPKGNPSVVIVPPLQAIAVANWIIATFSD